VHEGEVVAGRFEVERMLGQGGQGATALARDRETGEPVALKRLHVAHMEDWKTLELFEREGEALRALDHPNIPRYVAAPRTDEGLYLAQEHVAGQTLADLIGAPGALSLEDVLGCARAMLDTLAYLHRRTPPVVHRDLKPSNIIRREAGGWSLIDFGAVQAALTTATSIGTTVVGTAGYMPPEQAVGRAVPATDLYALGATLIHALTGRHPDAIPLERMRLQYRLLLPDADPRVVAWLDRLVEPHVEDRFASAPEARDALDRLERALAKGPASDAPEKPASRGQAIVIAAVVLVGVAIAGGFFLTVAPEPEPATWEDAPGFDPINDPVVQSVMPKAPPPPVLPPTPEPEPEPEPEVVAPQPVSPEPLEEDPHRKPMKMPWTRGKITAELVHARADLLGLELVEVGPDGVILRNGSPHAIRSLTLSLKLVGSKDGAIEWVDTLRPPRRGTPDARPGDTITITHHKLHKLKKARRGRVEVEVVAAQAFTPPEGGYPEAREVAVVWPQGQPRGAELTAVVRGSVPDRDDLCSHEVAVENTGERAFNTLQVVAAGTPEELILRRVDVNIYYNPVFATGDFRYITVRGPCEGFELAVHSSSFD
jgi:serine/threonine protein kinase